MLAPQTWSMHHSSSNPVLAELLAPLASPQSKLCDGARPLENKGAMVASTLWTLSPSSLCLH